MKNESCSCEHSLWLPYVMLSLTGGKKKTKQNSNKTFSTFWCVNPWHTFNIAFFRHQNRPKTSFPAPSPLSGDTNTNTVINKKGLWKLKKKTKKQLYNAVSGEWFPKSATCIKVMSCQHGYHVCYSFHL